MENAIISRIAQDVALPEPQVSAVVSLLEKGATPPFIAHYRKESTGGMDSVKILSIQERVTYYQEIQQRRNMLIKLLADQGKLTDDLRQRIESCYARVDLEDLFYQVKPRKRSRAAEAREKGLEPLAEYLWNQEPDAWSLEEHADVFIVTERKVTSREQALQGALDIIAEWIADNLDIRRQLREKLWQEGSVVSTVVPAKISQKTKYSMYYNRREPVVSIPSHRVLAIRRGTKEGILTSAIEGDNVKALDIIRSAVIRDKESAFAPLLEIAIRECYNHILRPMIETEVRAQLKERADREAIRVFQENLSNLLLSPPAGPMIVLGFDPGKGGECKLAVIDETGKLLETAAIYAKPPRTSGTTDKKISQKFGPPPANKALAAATGPTEPPAAPSQEIAAPVLPEAAAENPAIPEPAEVMPADFPADSEAAVQAAMESAPPDDAATVPTSPEAISSDQAAVPAILAQAEATPEIPMASAMISEPAGTMPMDQPAAEDIPAQTDRAPEILEDPAAYPVPAAIIQEDDPITPEPNLQQEVAPTVADVIADQQPLMETAEVPTAGIIEEAAVEPATELGSPDEILPPTKSPVEMSVETAPVIQTPSDPATPPPQNYLEAARTTLKTLLTKHKVQALAIGSGAGARELEIFLRQILSEEKIENIVIASVNDAGVAIYASSRAAREEFSDLNVSTRCAISLARRLQDPMSELVKIDPKLIGVGQYQHDVDQKELHRALVQTVQACVNHVGVNLNTAGYSLLHYVAGLNDKLARKIASIRSAKGDFPSRAAFRTLTGIDAQAYEQAAGFLRIRGGETPLDSTAVHPESHPIVEKMAASAGVGIAELIGNAGLISALRLDEFASAIAGLYTLTDIKNELLRPGRDPRRTFTAPKFRADIRSISDLKEGMTLEGTVTNVTNFGAFVDIGVQQDGLVHLSQMSNRFIKDPREAVKVGDVVQVKVISVEVETKRIGLSMKALLPVIARRRKKPRMRPGKPPVPPVAEPAAVAGKPVESYAAPRPPAVRQAPQTPQGRPAPRHESRQERDAHHQSRKRERRPERPQPPREIPAVEKEQERTLQEKIAILQSKFRGIS